MPEALVPARLAFQEGTPYSEAFGDVYHSAAGGPAQAEHVFLKGNALPARWAGRERFVILETGFGFGLNFLVTWQAWRRDPQRCARLHYVAVEKHPFSLPDLRTLHARYPELEAEAAELHSAWPMLVPGGHRVGVRAECGPDAVLRRHQGRCATCGSRRTRSTSTVSRRRRTRTCGRRSSCARSRASPRPAPPPPPGASRRRCAARSRQTGFAVEKRAGLRPQEGDAGRDATSDPRRIPAAPETEKPPSSARASPAPRCASASARAAGRSTLYERHAEPAQEASGNHAGTFHPIVTPDDSVFARLTRAGFLLRFSLEDVSDVRWDPCGVLQLARDAQGGSLAARLDRRARPAARVRAVRDARGSLGARRRAGRRRRACGSRSGGWIKPRVPGATRSSTRAAAG